MADDYIFGPISTDNPQYDKALPYANSWLVKGNAQRLPYGETITISRGELHPMIEQTMLDDLEARRQASQAKAEPKKEKRKKGRKSNYGRWELLNNFIDLAQTDFTGSQRAVWVTMFRLADGNSNKLYTSVRWIAKLTGTSDTTVQGAITKLIKKGWLVRHFTGPTKGVPSLFEVKDGSR